MNPKTRVLIVDDDVAMAKYLASHLSRRNFEVTVASSEQEALRVFRSFDPVLVLVETSMDGEAGAETLQRLKQIKPTVSIMVLSASKDPEVIFRASKLGADDYISKPVDPKELDARIGKVLDNQRLFSEVTQLREQVRRQSDFTMLFGSSPKMMEVKMTIEQVADTTATVLIRGESGTGKEVVARMVYSESSRGDKPFVKVNCAAIPHELLESELFGYEAGAFTGANRQKLGKFEQANGARFFSTKSARCTLRCRPSCCTCSRTMSSPAWAASVMCRWTCAFWPPPTNRWSAPWKRACFAKICFIA